ncbi:hypothetical protein BGW80DRAFT_865820 [Lactifluus volemus]|nr:hypothetical protein BGW80DRAFT_865820 [Lactifluus volemus]
MRKTKQQIRVVNPDAAARFLEHLVLRKKRTDPAFHTELAPICINEVLSFLADGATSKLWQAKGIYLIKSFLRWPDFFFHPSGVLFFLARHNNAYASSLNYHTNRRHIPCKQGEMGALRCTGAVREPRVLSHSLLGSSCRRSRQDRIARPHRRRRPVQACIRQQ